MERIIYPQALSTQFQNRIQNNKNSLYISTTATRATKRAKTVINYAEFDDANFDDFDDDNYTDKHHIQTARIENHTAQSKLAHKTKHINFSEHDLNLNSYNEEILIPIRIDLEHNGNRIVDFFMWNLNESLITPEQFALITCQDLDLPSTYQSLLSNSIKSQIEEFTNLVTIRLPKDIDIHVIINLSCNLDKVLYEDKFEWDLTNDAVTPEVFAKYIVSDMGLSLEFLPAIAHTLYEVILKLKKDCIEGHLPQEIFNQSAFGYEGGVRLDHEQLGLTWSPSVEELSQWEIEKREIEKERNLRRMKRESMRVEDKRGRRRRYEDLY